MRTRTMIKQVLRNNKGWRMEDRQEERLFKKSKKKVKRCWNFQRLQNTTQRNPFMMISKAQDTQSVGSTWILARCWIGQIYSRTDPPTRKLWARQLWLFQAAQFESYNVVSAGSCSRRYAHQGSSCGPYSYGSNRQGCQMGKWLWPSFRSLNPDTPRHCHSESRWCMAWRDWNWTQGFSAKAVFMCKGP